MDLEKVATLAQEEDELHVGPQYAAQNLVRSALELEEAASPRSVTCPALVCDSIYGQRFI